MISIYNALTANGSLSASGIKNLKVFYDTLLINFKSENYEFAIIENLDFDYDNNIISSSEHGALLEFGNTNRYEADKTSGNSYVDTILLEKEKTLLVCGLSAYALSAQIINNQTHAGSALTPVVYLYNLNTHEIRNIFPPDSTWSSNIMGNVTKYKDIAVSFNTETNILNYIIKATRLVNSVPFFFWTDIEMKYLQNRLTLTSVRCLTSLANNNLDIVSFRNFNNSEKMIVASDNGNLISFNI